MAGTARGPVWSAVSNVSGGSVCPLTGAEQFVAGDSWSPADSPLPSSVKSLLNVTSRGSVTDLSTDDGAGVAVAGGVAGIVACRIPWNLSRQSCSSRRVRMGPLQRLVWGSCSTEILKEARMEARSRKGVVLVLLRAPS